MGPPPPAQVLVLDGQGICGTQELEVADETELLEGVRDPSGLSSVDTLAGVAATLGEELSRKTGRAVGLVRAMVQAKLRGVAERVQAEVGIFFFRAA